MLDRGGKQKRASTTTHNGSLHQAIVLPKVAPHTCVQRALFGEDNHHIEMRGTGTTQGRVLGNCSTSLCQACFPTSSAAPSTSSAAEMDHHALGCKLRIVSQRHNVPPIACKKCGT